MHAEADFWVVGLPDGRHVESLRDVTADNLCEAFPHAMESRQLTRLSRLLAAPAWRFTCAGRQRPCVRTEYDHRAFTRLHGWNPF
jgi:hypothetical protein